MTQLEAVKAFKVLMSIGQEKIPVGTAYKLFCQKRALQPVFDFQIEQERGIIDRYNAVADERGNISPKNPADKPAMQSDLKELNQMECKIDIKPIEIELPEELHIALNDIEALEPVVKFVFKG